MSFVSKLCCPFYFCGQCPLHPVGDEDEPSPKRVCAAPLDDAPLDDALLVDAAIYVWCLDHIEADHPLFHISYFGQAVRLGGVCIGRQGGRTKGQDRMMGL